MFWHRKTISPSMVCTGITCRPEPIPDVSYRFPKRHPEPCTPRELTLGKRKRTINRSRNGMRTNSWTATSRSSTSRSSVGRATYVSIGVWDREAKVSYSYRSDAVQTASRCRWPLRHFRRNATPTLQLMKKRWDESPRSLEGSRGSNMRTCLSYRTSLTFAESVS